MLLEAILVVSLITNGWQFFQQGELSHSNEQLVQTINGQEKSLSMCYVERGVYERSLGEVEGERDEAYRRSKDQAVELERLRNSNPTVNEFMELELPQDLAKHLRSRSSDGN